MTDLVLPGLGPLAWIDVVLLGWFALTALSVLYVLSEPTTVHWHGLILPNAMDGPSEITQEPIPPSGSYTYEFTAQQQGTFFMILNVT